MWVDADDIFSSHTDNARLRSIPARQFRMAILGGISPIFRRFSADGTPSAVFPPTCLQITPISAYFPPKMLPHPCYNLKNGTPCICHPPTCLLIPPIFRLCSAPNLPLIFHRSCVVGACITTQVLAFSTRGQRRLKGSPDVEALRNSALSKLFANFSFFSNKVLIWQII